MVYDANGKMDGWNNRSDASLNLPVRLAPIDSLTLDAGIADNKVRDTRNMGSSAARFESIDIRQK
jgi:hypothetical protein